MPLVLRKLAPTRPKRLVAWIVDFQCCSHIAIIQENVDEDILTLGKGAHKVEIDLMQPLDPEKSPKVHIPALNHVGLWVDKLEACVEHLTAQVSINCCH